ncbi:hypothetical protein ADL25_03480 [Streptomyces sp. NRRL F-5122]|uniref:hypothetical protein n=1 Tax=Streptomyces sp. NRRL F-5122 TaxID=1609098 RepID=UPI000740F99A|nr:hypothetical protein [Streptomyces sp. NRRL F-5122]KUJ58398.1 hypothetical protein ADL25_03480 [Streptomyces sp. NRRL F-5122]
MKITGAAVAGLVFGSLTSLANVVSSPYGPAGARVVGSAVAKAGPVVSLLLDAGWSWAALAVAVGWAARTRGPGALGGALAPAAATVSYHVADASLWDAGTDMVVWLVVGVPVGLVLGLIGALVRRPGLTGLLAALFVPVGAAVQMVVISPGSGLIDAGPATVAADIVWAGAALSATWALGRFWRRRRAPGTV